LHFVHTLLTREAICYNRSTLVYMTQNILSIRGARSGVKNPDHKGSKSRTETNPGWNKSTLGEPSGPWAGIE
jgi:hypothetical protein